ncbi:CAP domain-containing protein [Leptolyngbya sp. NIES-2104]|uniref:CAP domain-containing protein n=1 Tax=Leptolyngbya sp. NIES-2104 TaxID=1552121 RepID=UPI0006EC9F74|nr:CAP domain-containing protein [Leptolyngbya sp. NIES-2104]GAP96160.1 transporter [Leptolyngbya sp. NIES-2104]
MIFRSVDRSNFLQTEQTAFGRRFQTPLTPAPQPDLLPVQPQSSSPAPLEVTSTVAPVQTDPNTGFRDLEWQVYDFTNQQRVQQGLLPLTLNLTLNDVAEKHSVDMAVRSYFSHQGLDGSLPWDRMKSGGYNYSRAAENIAFGYPSAQEVVTAWMNSPGHRQNILDPNLREIGVGYYNGYWTQNFGTAMQIA